MQTLADARAMLTEIGVGAGVWEEAMAEKEKWGSGLGEEESKGRKKGEKQTEQRDGRGMCREEHRAERWGLSEVYEERPGEKGRHDI